MSIAARAGTLYEIPRVPQRRPLESVARVIITRAGERMIAAELSRLRQQLEVDFPNRLREAHAFGDVDENDDYLQIKEEETVLASRIRQLQSVLTSAKVVEPSNGTSGIVTIGSLVEVEDLASGEIRMHRLTGGYERLGPDGVSASSPIGQALLGRAAGDTMAVALPNGGKRTLKISAVKQPVG